MPEWSQNPVLPRSAHGLHSVWANGPEGIAALSRHDVDGELRLEEWAECIGTGQGPTTFDPYAELVRQTGLELGEPELRGRSRALAAEFMAGRQALPGVAGLGPLPPGDSSGSSGVNQSPGHGGNGNAGSGNAGSGNSQGRNSPAFGKP